MSNLQPYYLGPGNSVTLPTGDKLTADSSGWIYTSQSLGPSRPALNVVPPNVASIVPVLVAVTTANRPTQGLYPGMNIFDTTLGKPIWCNAAGTGWVDATGTGV